MKQARGEARQSGGATSAASPNLGQGKEDTVEEIARNDALVERVAKALAGQFFGDESAWVSMVDEAEAAIKAMSEARPQSTVTEEMIEALKVAELTLRLDGERMANKGMSALQNGAALATVQAALSKVSPLD